MGGNKLVTSIGLKHLDELECLTSLDLRFSHMTDAALSVLSKVGCCLKALLRLLHTDLLARARARRTTCRAICATWCSAAAAN